MPRINEIIHHLETFAPLVLQESYDNAGLLVGDLQAEVSSALLTLDVTEEVVDEAVEMKAGLIVAHHPVIFSGLKKLTGRTYVERAVLKAIKHDVAIYAAHTNLDAAAGGVNAKICEKIGLKDCRVLQAVEGRLKKLVTFIPREAEEEVKKALFKAGAGHIGNYDSCGFGLEGTGSFRGNPDSNPYVGVKGQVHHENEIRFETIYPDWLQSRILRALLETHPYEEVAYDLYSLDNAFEKIGMGMTGILPEAIEENEFLAHLKSVFGTGCIRHTALRGKKVKRVAVCGGSGSSLLNRAIAAGADVFVSADFKYHQFFDADKKIVIADIGHFESEQFTKELFFELLSEKFPKFALRFSAVNTNPVYYY